MFGQEQAGSAEVRLRPAQVQDAEILWLWRNDPVTRVHSRSTEPISWKAHVAWLTAALADPARKIMIAEHGATPIGTVALHGIDEEWEISITVAPEKRGGGAGTAILQSACARTSHDIYASVRNGNRPSRRLFESCGFKAMESTETGFVRYLRSTDDHRRKQA
jgi:RimJ/RimL family protein N-acetyltransferase